MYNRSVKKIPNNLELLNRAVDTLKCFVCGNSFSTITTVATCNNLHRFDTDEEVLILETKLKLPKKFRWGNKLRNPKENICIDTLKGPKSKKSTQRRSADSISFIVSNSLKKSIVNLDIATGRGLFIRKLLPKMEDSVLFISDLDTDVLVGTNKLLQPLFNSENLLVAITASATHLPFQNNSISQVTCYGINNVRETEIALKEIFRVLKPGGIIVFTMSLIQVNSPSHAWLQTQKDKPGPLDVIDGWQNAVKDIGFQILKKEIIFDGPVEKIPLDLLPREDGERFQDVGIVLQKPM